MPNQNQANFELYRTLQEEEEKRRKQQRNYLRQEQRRAKGSGRGRFLGGLLGGLASIALAPIGAPILMAGALGGLGSRVGSEVGENMAGKAKMLKQSDYLFGKESIKDENFERRQARRDFNQGQWTGAATDAISAMTLAGMFKAKAPTSTPPINPNAAIGGSGALLANVPPTGTEVASQFGNIVGQAPQATTQFNGLQKIEALLEQIFGMPNRQTSQAGIRSILDTLF